MDQISIRVVDILYGNKASYMSNYTTSTPYWKKNIWLAVNYLTRKWKREHSHNQLSLLPKYRRKILELRSVVKSGHFLMHVSNVNTLSPEGRCYEINLVPDIQQIKNGI